MWCYLSQFSYSYKFDVKLPLIVVQMFAVTCLKTHQIVFSPSYFHELEVVLGVSISFSSCGFLSHSGLPSVNFHPPVSLFIVYCFSKQQQRF